MNWEKQKIGYHGQKKAKWDLQQIKKSKSYERQEY